MNFCPAGACAAGGGSEPALSVLMHDSLSREKEQSVPLFKMHRTDRAKTKVFFFFFFSESKKLLQLLIVRSIKRSPACLMLLWGKMGADGLWGGMFIESDPQFQNSKAFLLVHASERDFLGVKSFIVWKEDL